jgi:peptidoglycan/xylan/chitin deacetylase (PgdA/CDA1 family)
MLLTFDDGLRDHVDFVLPALTARGLFGLFYVPSGPALTGELLDVHKVHLVLGKLGGEAVLARIEARHPEILPPSHERGPAGSHYAAQHSDEATKTVKTLFNWKLTPEIRGPVLDALMSEAFEGKPPGWTAVYLDRAGLRTLTDAGMGVGPHGHSHIPFSRLAPAQLRTEIETSCGYVESAGGGREWGFCYPYGSPGAIGDAAIAAVAAAGCPFAFATGAADINTPLSAAPHSLPRYNCNAFPHGMATIGNTNER